MIHQLQQFFPALSELQFDQLAHLKELYSDWNKKINVISRKDIDNIEIHHILHSLSIALIFSFGPGTRIMDAGTGGGFPGIPLAITFPEVQFTLVDSIGKKINVVTAIKNELGLHNVIPIHGRAEEVKGQFDFITGRAVAPLPDLYRLLAKKIKQDRSKATSPGLLYLKGGDIQEELQNIPADSRVFSLGDYFEDSFFETKKLVYLYNFNKLRS
jgi:16S rRNA (guanine527-N7)-methyltransferase